MTNFVKLRESIGAARAEILKPANERADAIRLKMLREQFGEDFQKIDQGFTLAGVSLTVACDQFDNLNVTRITSLPPIDKLEKFAEVILYLYESAGSNLLKAAYPFRTVTGFFICLSREFFKEIDKKYVEEMLRVGDLYCEKNSGFRKWAFGHYGTTHNCPKHWNQWFPEIEDMRLSRERALTYSRTRRLHQA